MWQFTADWQTDETFVQSPRLFWSRAFCICTVYTEYTEPYSWNASKSHWKEPWWLAHFTHSRHAFHNVSISVLFWECVAFAAAARPQGSRMVAFFVRRLPTLRLNCPPQTFNIFTAFIYRFHKTSSKGIRVLPSPVNCACEKRRRIDAHLIIFFFSNGKVALYCIIELKKSRNSDSSHFQRIIKMKWKLVSMSCVFFFFHLNFIRRRSV